MHAEGGEEWIGWPREVCQRLIIETAEDKLGSIWRGSYPTGAPPLALAFGRISSLFLCLQVRYLFSVGWACLIGTGKMRSAYEGLCKDIVVGTG